MKKINIHILPFEKGLKKGLIIYFNRFCFLLLLSLLNILSLIFILKLYSLISIKELIVPLSALLLLFNTFVIKNTMYDLQEKELANNEREQNESYPLKNNLIKENLNKALASNYEREQNKPYFLEDNLIKVNLSKVLNYSYFTGFWAVAFKFFKFEFVRGIFDSLAPPFYKIIIFFFSMIFNTIGAFVFLVLAVIHSFSILIYIIPKIIISAIKNAISF